MAGNFSWTSGRHAFITGITQPIPSNIKKLNPIISKYVVSIGTTVDFGGYQLRAEMKVKQNPDMVKTVRKIMQTPKIIAILNLYIFFTHVIGAKIHVIITAIQILYFIPSPVFS